MRSLLSEVDACCLGGNYTEIVWQQTLLRHLRMTITTFQMLRNKIGPVSQVMPSHSAKQHDFFDACRGIYLQNAFPSSVIRINPQSKTTSSKRNYLFIFEMWCFQRYLTTNSYVFYEVAMANSYDLTRTILYDLSKPQWRVGLGAGLDVGNLYKFIRIGNS